MPVDRDIVWQISKHHLGCFAAQEISIAGYVPRVPACEDVLAALPDIAQPRDTHASKIFWFHLAVFRLRWRAHLSNQDIDFTDGEPRVFNIEVAADLLKLDKLESEQTAIPAGVFG